MGFSSKCRSAFLAKILEDPGSIPAYAWMYMTQSSLNHGHPKEKVDLKIFNFAFSAFPSVSLC